MKRITLLLLLLITIVSCKKQDSYQETEIIITTAGETIEDVEIYRSEQGIDLWSNKVTKLKKNDQGEFVLKLIIDTAEYARIKAGDNRAILAVFPGQKYKVHFTEKTKEFSLDNAKGQEILNNADRIPAQTFVFLNRFTKDSTPELVSKKIAVLKGKETSKMDSLLATKEIDESFYKYLQKEADFYYANAAVSVADFKSRRNKALKNDYVAFIEKTLEQYPYSKPDLIPYSWQSYVSENFVSRNVYNSYSRDQLDDYYDKDSIHFLFAQTIQTEIKEQYKEPIFAYYIINSVKQKRHEKSLIKIFDDFKTTYPKSSYIKYLEADIQEIKEYQDKIARGLSDDVNIIEDEKVNTFKDLLSKFKGEKLYVDMWATWCGPCKKEFEVNHKIDKLLKDNGYKKLYISVDRASVKDKWIELIKFYDLAGYHHLANKAFFKHFANNYTNTKKGRVSLPQYLIIDEKGTIVTKNAPRPSQYKDLERALKNSK
ncbi:TlpA family protein disulfide reductase [Pseudotenacibaculum haliotis]|uniref:TlpA family protein disulfide reductase n=1 Tax=Pseudotenacibaculum haliotis TaxID=1862138 RepID=A0ABW5LSE9_9FLAO